MNPRMIFPALLCGITLMVLRAESSDPLLAVDPVMEPLPWFDSQLRYAAYDASISELRANTTVAVTSEGRPPLQEPFVLQLSRCIYPAEDGHLDGLIRFDAELNEKPAGGLKFVLEMVDGSELSRAEIEDIPASQLHFSYRLPAHLEGESGRLRLIWEREQGAQVQTAQEFSVSTASLRAESGRVSITIPNTAGAVVGSAPMTVGVPFPAGVLMSIDHLRLVDAGGQVLPLQVTETARWSRFGSIQWVHCDFTVDLEGEPVTVYLEYGPDIQQPDRPAMEVVQTDFPTVIAGRLKIDAAGLWYRKDKYSAYQKVLKPEALRGAFVQRTRGINYADASYSQFSNEGLAYTMGTGIRYTVEEQGSEKVVIRAEGWYQNPETDETFCQWVVRYVLFQNSSIVRIFHTWIFTGDGNRDSIRSMGWRFPVEGLSDGQFLTSYTAGDWHEGYYLRQEEADQYTLFAFDPKRAGRKMSQHAVAYERPLKKQYVGERAPGVMRAKSGQLEVVIGIQDFWQNFPSSLQIDGDALIFNQWPRYGRERIHPVRTDDIGNLWRLWFVHEGETLNFTLPTALTESPIYQLESRSEPHYAYGQPDSVNAQGIAKTAEMWIYVTESSADDTIAVMEGLAEESIRAVVDPQWVMASGVFYESAPADTHRYPEYEAAFAAAMRSPLRQVERMGVYGKWIYGDLLRTADLDTREAHLYRVFRKGHWGWPFSWQNYARSGDLEFLRFSQAATRMMTDTAFCHYVDEKLADYFANDLSPRQMWTLQQPFRRIGWHNRNLIPWAGYWGPSTRMYVDQADFLWDAWYLTGYHRARDIALEWAKQTKIEEADKLMRGPITAAENRARWPANLQKQYIEMYQATWDPWFLAAAHAIAELHLWRFREEGYAGHFWNAGYVTWQRYSGCGQHAEFVTRNAEFWAEPQQAGWAATPTTILPALVFSYLTTGNEYHLRRAAGVVDLLRWALYSSAEYPYYEGLYVYGTVSDDLLFKSWLQLWYPWVIEAFNRAGGEPDDPIYPPFDLLFKPSDRLAVVKEEGVALPLQVQGKYTLYGPDADIVRSGDDKEIEIPAAAPAGVYTLSLQGFIRLPITPYDTPEVFVAGGDNEVGAGNLLAQYWFMVPEDVESFWVEFDNSKPPRGKIRQWMLWSPEGEVVWVHRDRDLEYADQEETIRAEIEVSPDRRGKLWRITMPGRHNAAPFRLSPNLPPYFAHQPKRWFDPQQ